MKRIVIILFLAAALVGLASAAITTWPNTDQRPYYFQADRGTVTDSIATLGGDTLIVITRRKWMTSSNSTIWAYPSYYSGADTAGQGIAASYLGGSRYLWYLANPTYGVYTFYETGGADSLISELQNVVILGHIAPDSSIAASSIRDGAINDSLMFGASMMVPRAAIPTTIGHGGGSSQIIQGIIETPAAVKTPALIPTGGTFTPSDKSDRVRVGGNFEIQMNNLILGPVTNANACTFSIADSASG